MPKRDRRDRILDEGARSHDRQSLLRRPRTSSGLWRRPPPAVLISTPWRTAPRAEAELPQHHEAMKLAPASSRQALMICTQVVAVMPPNSTYTIISTPTMATAYPVVQAEQQLDQLAGADHLRDQVERHHHQRAGGREGADRGLLEAVGGDVGEGELAEVAQLLGHQEGDDRPADQEADRVDQAVVAVGHHRRGNAQERGRRHVVAGDRQAVLEAGDAAAGGVEVRRRTRLRRGPLGDPQRGRRRTRRTC
jgi:hypothetical protein